MSEEIKNRSSRDSAAFKNDSSKEKSYRKLRNEKRRHYRSRSRSYSRSRSRSRSKSRSRSPKDKSYKKSEVNYDIPDRSFGDLFCPACDCHMNGEQMWESHIQGKRHLKVTKSKGLADTKYEYLDEDPIIKSEIDADTRLLIGLQHICEIQRLEQMPIYSCFLCSSTLPNYERLTEHILGFKHRLAYIKEHDLNQYEVIQKSQLRKCHLESIVEECIMTHEKNHGRGKMIVKKEKSRTAVPPYKKSHSYYHDSYSSHTYPRHERSSYSEWKKISSSSPKYYKRERHSSEGRSDSDTDKYYFRREESESRPYNRTSAVRNASPPSESVPSHLRKNENSKYRINEVFENVDLRKVLEQKKNLVVSAIENKVASVAESTSMASSDIIPSSSSITNISDSMLKFINDLTPEMFLHLALFKLDNMDIQEEKIIKLLDRLINKATALSCDIKANKIFPSLQAKFQESMVQNGLFTQSNSDFTQNMENLIQHYKSQKSFDESHINQFQNSGVLDKSDLLASQSKSDYFPTQSNSNNYSRYMTAPRENSTASTSYDYTWNRNSTPVPFKGFSSTPSSIPGLTLTEEIISLPEKPATQTYERSPFEDLAEHARNILGNLNMPLRKNYR